MPSYINNIQNQNKETDELSGMVQSGLGAIPVYGQAIGAAYGALNAGSKMLMNSITKPGGGIDDKDKGKFGLARALNPLSYLNGINNTNAFNKMNGAAKADQLMNVPKLPQAQMQQNYAAYAKKGRKLKTKNSPFKNQTGITKIKPMYGGIGFYENGEKLK